MGNFHEIIKVPEGALAWIYLFSENGISYVAKHWHHSVELTLITEGEAEYTVNGLRKIARKGDLLLINSGDLHSCQVTPGACEAVNIMFPNSYLSQFLGKGEQDAVYFQLDATKTEYGKLIRRCEKLYGVFRSRRHDPFAQLQVNSLVCDVAYLLLSAFRWEEFSPQSVESEKYRARCREILDYVDKHYTGDMTLDSLAAEMCISREHLARVFRDHMGTTFKKHLTRVRMYHAYHMLTNTDLPVLRIALDCGFSDSRAFIASFRAVYGTTPAKYRREFYQNVNGDFKYAVKMEFFYDEEEAPTRYRLVSG